MSSSIPTSAYVEHFDPELAHHRAWLLAVLERLVTHDPQALEEGGTLRRLWTEHQLSASAAGTQTSQTDPPLSGSQPQAARALAMHQSTVSLMRLAMEAQAGSR